MFVPIIFESSFNVSSVRSVLAIKSHRRSIMGLQQSFMPVKKKKPSVCEEWARLLQMLPRITEQKGSQDLEVLFPLRELVNHIVGQKDVLKSFSVIEHRSFWFMLSVEIRHKSYGELGIWSPWQQSSNKKKVPGLYHPIFQ